MSPLLRCVQLQRLSTRLLGGKPSFSSLLGLDSLDPSQLSYQEKILTLTLKESSSRLRWKHDRNSEPFVLLSTYLALVDEVTTWALFEADVTKGRPGVSLGLDGHILEDSRGVPDTLEIVARVEKVGKTVAFLNATIQDPKTQTILCRATHVKYLPSLGWINDLALSQAGWPWFTWWYGVDRDDKAITHKKEHTNDSILQDSFQNSITYAYNDNESNNSNNKKTTATFRPLPEMNNGFGTLHGGAQAMLVELVARHYVTKERNVSSFSLESLQMEYQAAASSKAPVTIQVVQDDQSRLGRWITIQVTNAKGHVCSTGLCLFSNTIKSNL